MPRFAVLMCIIPTVLIHNTTRHTVHTQHFITVIQKAPFRLPETAIAISSHISEMSQEIHIYLAIPMTVTTYGRDFAPT
jgi:hypothetical protein